MPELPEVETVRRGLNQHTLARSITGTEVLLPRTIAAPDTTAEFIAALHHTQIRTWHRRGKYLYAELTAAATGKLAGWLGVHLRMTGQLLWVQPDADLQKHTRVPGFESWWDVPVAEVSTVGSVQAARAEYVENEEKERFFY